MTAVVVRGPGVVALEERPIPKPDAGEVLVAVAACGLCATDRHIAAGTFPATFPRILGHEIVGTVTAVGGDVPGLKPGDRVALNPNRPCRTCAPCRRGDVHLCLHLQNLGISQDGGLAPFIVAHGDQAHRLPDSLAFAAAVLTEPLSCCLHGLDLAGVRPGDRVVVTGLGPIGRLMAVLSRRAGAASVYAVEPNAAVREDARHLVDRADATWLPELPEADVVVEAAGHPDALAAALEHVRAGGTVLQFGVAEPDARVPLSPYAVYRREIRLVGAFTNPFTMDRAVTLLAAGAIPVEAILEPPRTLDAVPAWLTGSGRPTGRKAWVSEVPA
jgi:L-iditol 2-dehydrogenase